MWYVIEFQTSGSTGSLITLSFADRTQAETSYHEKLMYASQSQIAKHGVMLVNDDMFVVKSEMYVHDNDA